MDRQRELDIVEAVKGGDFRQFETIVKAYQSPLTTFIYRIVKTEDDARDICQDTLFKAYRAIGSFKGNSKFSTWIFKIAYNASLNHIKKNMPISQWEPEEMGKVPDPMGGAEPSKKMEEIEIKRQINRLLQEMSPQYALPLHLFYKEGLLYREIADILKKPMNSVKSDILRGKEILKDKMSGFIR